MKKASGVVANIYCVKCKKKTPKFTVVGYDDTRPRGGIQITGTCAAGHENMSSFMTKKGFAEAVSAGKVIKGSGKCPYGGNDDNKIDMSAASSSSSVGTPIPDSGDVTLFEGAAARRRRSRSKSRDKKGAKAHKSRSKSHSKKSKSKSRSHSRKHKK